MDFIALLDAPAEAVKRTQVAKLGDFRDGRYGEFSITADNVKSWQTNLSKLPGGKALIDFDHKSERSPRDTQAAGWITGVDLDGDKVMADIDWTPLGKQAIQDKVYQFFSPAYGPYKDETGTAYDDTLCSGALTNRPFLGSMPTLMLASEERVSEAVDSELERLVDMKLLDVSAKDRKQAAADGNALSDGTYPIRNAAELHSAAVLCASGHGDVQGARKLIRKRAGELGVSLSHLPGFKAPASADSRRSMEADTLIKTLGLEDGADDQKILDAITELTKKPAGETKTLEQQAADEGKVLLDQTKFTQLASDAAAGKQAADELKATKFETTFTRALESGRAVPAQKEQLEKFYALDAQGTLAMLNEGPQLVNVRPAGQVYQLDGSDVPAGAHAGGHAMHEKVKARLKELGQDDTHYAEVATVLMSEGSR